jgi:hypothetical protein
MISEGNGTLMRSAKSSSGKYELKVAMEIHI